MTRLRHRNHQLGNPRISRERSLPRRDAIKIGRPRLVVEQLEQRALLDGLGVISGTVFDDLDHDGQLDPGEPGLEGWSVRLQRVGSTNTPDLTFQNPTPDAWSEFGRFVSFVGDNVVVGSHYDDVSGFADSGAVYLFDGASGRLLQTLISPHPAEGDRFGRAVAGTGNRVLVGAPLDDTAAENAGAVYVFDGTTGALLQSFFSPTPDVDAQFGRDVTAVGDRVLIGARLADLERQDAVVDDAGAAYLFDLETGQLLHTFISPTPTQDAQFGYSVAAMGDNVLVGARNDRTSADGAGAVYLFDGQTGNLLQRYLNPTRRASGESADFGRTVAAVGNNVLVGARWDDSGDHQAGSAFLFDGASGTLLQTFTSPTPVVGEEFGFTVAALDDHVLVSARWDNRQDGADNGGAVYLYDGATGDLLQTFANPVPGAWDAFGVDTAASGGEVLVGSQYGNAVYLFHALPSAPRAVTDAQGSYRFSELAAGTYRVVATEEQGYVPTRPAAQRTFTVVVADDSQIAGLDFAFVADQRPVAAADTYAMVEDGVLWVGQQNGPLRNDSDADADPLTVVLVNLPPYGELLLAADGSFQYNPDPDFAGSDSFTYRAHDGLAGSNLATVTITVEAVNDAPNASDDGLWIALNTARRLEAPGLLFDDYDADGDRLTALLVDAPSHGTVTLEPDGSVVYIPDTDYLGPDRFTYRVSDGQLASDVAAVDVRVTDQIFESLLSITEINYAPYLPTPREQELGVRDPTGFEFIELQNAGDRRIDLAGLQLTGGVEFVLDESVWLETGGRALIVKDRRALETRYGAGLRILGEYSGDLEDSGDRVVLRDPLDQVILSVAYGATDDWSPRAHGYGSTLEVIDTRGDFADGSNWRPSRIYGGSPGTEGFVGSTVVINELLTHANLPLTDAIELHNVTNVPLDIGGWYLSDTANDFRQFRIPDGTFIAAGGYVAFDEYDFNPQRWNPQAGGFALDSGWGEDLWLTAADAAGNLTEFVDQVHFGPALNGESLGRWPNATGELHPLRELTLGRENTGPRVGPILISEIMYHPPAPPSGIARADLEFVEIYNPTDERLDTPNWSLRGAADFDFPTVYGFPVPQDIPGRITLNPHSALVLVSFDPRSERDKLREFRAFYGIDASIQIAGPLVGRLGNAADSLRLVRPDYPPQWEPHHFPGVLEDEVGYTDSGLWSPTADGQGDSLQRRRPDLWGNDPNAWLAKPPTPGTVELRFGSLAISELNFNPHGMTDQELATGITFDGESFEFVELLNYGVESLDIGGVRLENGIDFEFPPGTTLAAGATVVVAKDPAAFQLRYGAQPVLGPYGGNLSNGGEQITLSSQQYGRILDFTYSDEDPWPDRADGEGSSLELIDPDRRYSDGTNWRPSSTYGGSPGRRGDVSRGPIVINEVLARPDGDRVDTIELHNPTDEDLDVGGWFLSDSSRNLRRYTIPPNTTVPRHGYLLFDEYEFNPSRWDPTRDGFGLDSAGERLFLTRNDADDQQLYFVDDVAFGVSRIGESFGRWPDGAGMLSPMDGSSLGQANRAPRIGPVIISELVYHPRESAAAIDAEQLEFVEVYNPGDTPVDLARWQLSQGIQYQFAAETVLDPRGSIVVAPFDPSDSTVLRIFRHHYRMNDSVTVVGPYSGRLSNVGDTLRLMRAEAQPPDQPGDPLLLLEDAVSYDDRTPWSAQPDGYGHSLNRRGPSFWGNDARSWVSAWPTPGMGVLVMGDADRDGRFNETDFVQVFQAGEYEDALAENSTWDEGDYNGDGEFDSSDLVLSFQSGAYRSTDPLDVDADGLVTAVDALLIINALNDGLVGSALEFWMDTNRDGAVTPLDALSVINELNSQAEILGDDGSVSPIQQLFQAAPERSDRIPVPSDDATAASVNAMDPLVVDLIVSQLALDS